MKAQIINNKIVAIGEEVKDNGLNEVFPIDIEILPKTEEGELDYEAIFNLEIEIKNDKLTVKNNNDGIFT